MKDNLFLKYRYARVIFISLVCFLFVASCGIDQKKSEQKKDTAIAFLKYYRNEILKNKSILLLDTPAYYSIQDCLLQVTYEKEYTLFDKEDFSDEFHSTLWDKKSIDGVKLISKENLPNIMTPQSKSDFRKNFGEGYYVFSHPIVSKDLKHILFFTAYWCSERCGYGSLGLYERTKAGWRLVKKYCDWVS